MTRFGVLAQLGGLLISAPLPALAQAPPSPATLVAAQRDAMKVLAVMDGVWRGNAWTILRDWPADRAGQRSGAVLRNES